MAAARRARSAGSALGFRRVRCVVLHHDPTSTRAEVVGIAHRCPRRLAVPLSVAEHMRGGGGRG